MSDTELIFPEAYKHWQTMVVLSKNIKDNEQEPFCKLPFCHTVEAEAMGGLVNYGNEHIGPRASGYCCKTLEELMELPSIDFNSGRIYEVLLACRELNRMGEHVLIQISGPFTILNTLIDIKEVYKGLRRKPDLIKNIFWKLGRESLRFIDEAGKIGAEMISYADPPGDISILGPVMSEFIEENFTCGFLKKAQKIAEGRMLIILCPKTTESLLRTQKAVYREYNMPEQMSYQDACIKMRGRAKIAGQTCVHSKSFLPGNRIFKEIVLQ